MNMKLPSQLDTSKLGSLRKLETDDRQPFLQRAVLFSVPVLACFGSALPVLGNVFAFRVVTLLFLVATLFQGKEGRSNSRLTVLVPLLAFVWGSAALALPLLRGVSGYAWAEGISLFVGVSLLVAISAVRFPRQALRTLLHGYLVAYFATSMIALREILLGETFYNYYQPAVESPIIDGLGSASTFGNPNNYAFFLTLSLPVLVLGATIATTKTLQITYVVALLSIPYFMVATDSRLGIAFLLILAAGFAFVFLRSRFIALAVGALCIAILAFSRLVGLALESITKPLASLWLQDLVTSDASTMVRINLIKNGLVFTFDSYLLGWGPGGYESRMESGSGIYPTSGIVNPHSGLVEILSQYGVVVFAVVLVLLASLFSIGWKSIPRSNDLPTRVAGLVLVSLITLFPFMTTMNSSFLEPSTSWLLLAVLLLIGLTLTSATPLIVPGRLGPPQKSGRESFPEHV